MSTNNNEEFNAYLLEPKAPLIIRSGRPFDEQYGADNARFPPPSTMAGALRAAYARTEKLPFNGKATQQILNTATKGPLPVKIKDDGTKVLLVPKPEDARYYYDGNGNIEIIRLAPAKFNKGEGWDLDDKLLPIAESSVSEDRRGKPAPGPEWWSYQHLQAWRNQENLLFDDIFAQGWTPPSDDMRTHVAISPETYSAEDGKLFQTAGLPMWQKVQTAGPSQVRHPLPDEHIAILGCVQGEITGTAVNLGGERRLAEIHANNDLWPKVDEAQINAILEKTKQLTLTLLTPAIFEHGWLPCKQNEEGKYIYKPNFIKGLELELVAAAVGRWQANSGWDLAKRAPKPSTKLAPAGTVYWFTLIKGGAEQLNALWLANISTKEQDRKDGFGLALPHSTSIDTNSTAGAQ